MRTTTTTRRTALGRASALKQITPQSEGSPPSEMRAGNKSAGAASRFKSKVALSRKPARQLHFGHAVLKRTLVPCVVVLSHCIKQHVVACLEPLLQAARCASQAGVICKRRGVTPVKTRASNVGIARAADARWLVFTDAGSVAAPGVLSALALCRLFGRCA